MSISLSVEEVSLMQQQLQEAQHLKAELERVTAAAAAREAQGSASLREATAQMNEAAAQMSAAQEVAQIAREKEAEAAVAMRKQQELSEGMAALRDEVEHLYESRQQELDAAEAARLDAEADAAVEKATVASERARADALRSAAQEMEEELQAVHEEAAARVSAAEERAHRADEKFAQLRADGELAALETKRLVGLIEEETAAKVTRLEASVTAASNRAAEADSEVATLSARLRAGELHLSAAVAKWEGEREAGVEAAKKDHKAQLEALRTSLEGEHADIHKAALERMSGLCAELKSHSDELESLREENAQLRTKVLNDAQEKKLELVAADTSRASSPAESQPTSPTVRLGPEVALVAATRRTDGLERECGSLRQEVLRLQRKLAGYRAREQEVIKAARHSGFRGGSPGRAMRAAQREHQREQREEEGRRRRSLSGESGSAEGIEAVEDDFLQTDGEDSPDRMVRFGDSGNSNRKRNGGKSRRKTSPRRAAKERRASAQESLRSARAARARSRTIGTQTTDEIVLVSEIEPLLVELPDALAQEVARRTRAEELLQALYQAQQDVARHTPQSSASASTNTAAATAKAAVSGKPSSAQAGSRSLRSTRLDLGEQFAAEEEEQQEQSAPQDIPHRYSDAYEDEEDEEDEVGEEDEDTEDESEILSRWQSWTDMPPDMPPTPKRGDNNDLTVISTGNYDDEDGDDEDAPTLGGAVGLGSAGGVDAAPTSHPSSTAAQDRWALRVDAAVAATMPPSDPVAMAASSASNYSPSARSANSSSTAAATVVGSEPPVDEQSPLWELNERAESGQGLGLDDSVQDIIIDNDEGASFDETARVSPRGGVSPAALTLAELNELATQGPVPVAPAPAVSMDTPRPTTQQTPARRGRGGRGGRGRGRAGRSVTSGATGVQQDRVAAAAPVVSQASALAAEQTEPVSEDQDDTQTFFNGLSADTPAFEMQQQHHQQQQQQQQQQQLQTEREMLEELEREDEREEAEAAAAAAEAAGAAGADGTGEPQEEISATLGSLDGAALPQEEQEEAAPAAPDDGVAEVNSSRDGLLLVICPEGVGPGDPVRVDAGTPLRLSTDCRMHTRFNLAAARLPSFCLTCQTNIGLSAELT
jgi:hypothetical protein